MAERLYQFSSKRVITLRTSEQVVMTTTHNYGVILVSKLGWQQKFNEGVFSYIEGVFSYGVILVSKLGWLQKFNEGVFSYIEGGL